MQFSDKLNEISKNYEISENQKFELNKSIENCKNSAMSQTVKLTELMRDRPEIVAEFLGVRLIKDYTANGTSIKKTELGEVVGRYTLPFFDFETVDVGLRAEISKHHQSQIKDCQNRSK